MTPRLRFGVYFALFLVLQIKLGLMSSACGYGNVELEQTSSTTSEGSGGGASDESGETGEECTESGETVSTDVITATITGDPCSAPAASASDSDMLLGCTERSTTDPDTDYTTLSCTSDAGEITQAYFCEDGVVIKDDGAAGVEEFATTTISCGVEGFSESEIIVSSISDF